MSDEPLKSFYELLTEDPDAALKDVIARRKLHYAVEHGTSLDVFHDCATCGVLDKQLERARRAVA